MGTNNGAAVEQQNEASEPPEEPLGGRLRVVPHRHCKVRRETRPHRQLRAVPPELVLAKQALSEGNAAYVNLWPQVIHLIRHGEGFHNAAGHRDANEYGSCEWLDAHLTPTGWQQAWALNSHIRALGTAFCADLVVVSPLVRTLETAAGVFGAGRWQADEPQPPLMLVQVRCCMNLCRCRPSGGSEFLSALASAADQ